MTHCLTAAAIAASLSICSSASAQLIDDFETPGLPEYTATVILDANGGAPNVSAFSDPAGQLQFETTTFDGIEQTVLIRNGLSLSVGEELQAEFNLTGSQDFGLYVGGTAPTAGVREDYVSVYARDNGQVFSRGFDGTTEFGLTGGGTPAYESLFIARTEDNTYELGFYEGGVRNIVTTRTPTFANDGEFVGFYTDARAAGVTGFADNLTIVAVPEPASLGLLGIGALALIRRR